MLRNVVTWFQALVMPYTNVRYSVEHQFSALNMTTGYPPRMSVRSQSWTAYGARHVTHCCSFCREKARFTMNERVKPGECLELFPHKLRLFCDPKVILKHIF